MNQKIRNIRNKIRRLSDHLTFRHSEYSDSLKKGFTLVELILSMGIFMALMTLIFRVFLAVIETRLSSEATSAVTQDAQYIYSRLAYDISRSSSVVQPANPGTTGSTLELVSDGQHILYTVGDAQDLAVDEGSGPQSLNSSGTKVAQVVFSRRGGVEGAQSITFDITLLSTTTRVGSGSVTRHVTGTIGTR